MIMFNYVLRNKVNSSRANIDPKREMHTLNSVVNMSEMHPCFSPLFEKIEFYNSDFWRMYD